LNKDERKLRRKEGLIVEMRKGDRRKKGKQWGKQKVGKKKRNLNKGKWEVRH
jgi:hypothetical protein